MSLLTRDSILQADDRKTQDVPVAEWGGTVRVKAMSGYERDKFETSMVKMNGSKRQENFSNIRARLVALVCVNEDGGRMFTDADITLLGTKSAAALQRVFNVAQELNGMSDSDVEELTESFDETPDESSTSA